MNKLVILFALFCSLLLAQPYPCNSTKPATIVCDLAVGDDCTSNTTVLKFCGVGLFCNYYNGLPYKCSGYGQINQTCTSTGFADCYNVTQSLTQVKCINSTCQFAGFLGVGENCTFNEECVTSTCTNGSCDANPYSCATPGSCPYGTHCNVSKCVNDSVAGDNCTADNECANILQCFAGKCALPFSVDDGGNCTASYQCGGKTKCSGCRLAKSGGVCSPDLIAAYKFGSNDCMNATDNGNCTIGVGQCSCNGTNYKCVEDYPFITWGGCAVQLETLHTCVANSGCTGSFLNPKISSFILSSPAIFDNRTCVFKKCSVAVDCLQKCISDIIKTPPVCPKLAPTFKCTLAATCQPVVTTTSSSSSTSTSSGTSSGTSTATSATSTATSATSTATSATSTSTKTSTATSTNSSTSASTSSSSSTGTGSSTSFGLVLIAPLLSFITLFLF